MPKPLFAFVLFALAAPVAWADAPASQETGRALDRAISDLVARGEAEGLIAAPILVAQAAIPNPAEEARKRSDESGKETGPFEGHVPTYRMPAVKVTGHASPYREEERIGSYAQPRWTAHRRFPTTRVYVRPEGEFDLEFWTIAKTPRHGHTEWLTQTEAEIGLPYRFQLDFYLISRREGSQGMTYFDQSGEIRWALANWGAIPANPTLYFEWTMTDSAPDVGEAKILLGDEIAPSWHWGVNLACEQQAGGEREREFELTAAISKTLIDEKLSVGLEGEFSWADAADNRGSYAKDFRLGPTIQWRPTPGIHVDFAPLFGLSSESRRSEVYFVVGIEL